MKTSIMFKLPSMCNWSSCANHVRPVACVNWKIAEALVRTVKLLLKGYDVKPIVAAADCLPRLGRSQHTMIPGIYPGFTHDTGYLLGINS